MSSEYLNALNVGSGLDTTKIVDAIVNAQQVPRENVIKKNITTREVQTSSFSEIKNALSSFRTGLGVYSGINGISLNNNGTSVTASLSNVQDASAFSHEISVSSLASSQVLAFADFSSPDAIVGTGTLSFNFGTWSNGNFTSNGTNASVTISDGNGTLEGIAASINDADIGVTASIVKEKDDSYYLMLKSSEGLSNAMQITVTEDVANSSLDALAYTAYDGSKEIVAASNASLTIDGAQITRNSNQITDIISGVTFTLNSTSSNSETISAGFDTNTALVAAQGFVAELNNLTALLRSKSARGTQTTNAGDLAGDPLVRSLLNQISELTNEAIVGFDAEPKYLANYGILTNRDGSLSLDSETFTQNYESSPASFNAILSSRVTSDSSLVSGTISGKNFVPGNYAFVINGNNATIDGNSMTFADNEYSISTGNTAGLILKTEGSGANTTIRIGQSLLDKLDSFAATNLAFGNDIDERVSQYNQDISDYAVSLSDFQKQMGALREQYTQQFSAMDTAIASLNKTKESLDMMMEGWRGSMKR